MGPGPEADACTFCSIVDGSGPTHEIVGETPLALAFMNAFPVTFGHTLVVPKRHAEHIWALEDADAMAVWSLTRAVAVGTRAAFHPDGLNLFQANGARAWQSEFHFHFHVVPRWIGDDLVPNWTTPMGDRTRIPEAAQLLRAQLAQLPHRGRRE